MADLRPFGFDVAEGTVYVLVADEAGNEHRVALDAFDVTALIDGLNEARAQALEQPAIETDLMLPLTAIAIGVDENPPRVLMRLQIGPHLKQKFWCHRDTELGHSLLALERAVANVAAGGASPASKKH